MLKLDGYTLKIPPHSFSKSGSRKYKFDGTIDGQDIEAELRKRDRKGFKWTFKFSGKDADVDDVDDIDSPIAVFLAVGNDSGETSVKGSIKGSKGGDDDDDDLSVGPGGS